MREFESKKIEAGEHILIDGVEYVVEHKEDCSECAFKNSKKCDLLPCCAGGSFIFTKVQKEPTYRPYKDTAEMIADWTERFMVDEIADFCMPMIWVKDKPAFLTVGVGTHLIVEILDCVVRLSNSIVNLQNLFDYYTYLDGSPCGKVEE